jgi:hypothetical protein
MGVRDISVMALIRFSANFYVFNFHINPIIFFSGKPLKLFKGYSFSTTQSMISCAPEETGKATLSR